ncbi:MAG: SsrA-binding protein [Sphingomonas bacterium]|nr:SsrA-binding protein [Sphingomonas bacterium]
MGGIVESGGGIISGPACATPLPFRASNAYIARPMSRPKPPVFEKTKIVAENRRAKFDYAIDTVYEAGIALTGTEVKSLRDGTGSIAESYAEVKDGQVWLINSNVPEFSHGNRFNHEPKRPRKLLLHEREINKMHGAVAREGMTLVPLMIYFNAKGRAKVELALAKGKKDHDKRATIKERDWKREQGRIMRDRG